MYSVNIPCSFITELKSRYVVQLQMLIRYKFDGTKHENPKNIYYASEETKNLCIALRRNCSYYLVREVSDSLVSFTSYREDKTEIGACILQRQVQIGLFPIDMLLSPDGEGVPGNDRFYHGHRVTEIVE